MILAPCVPSPFFEILSKASAPLSRVKRGYPKTNKTIGEKMMRNAIDAILPFREDLGDVLGSLGAEVIFSEIE